MSQMAAFNAASLRSCQTGQKINPEIILKSSPASKMIATCGLPMICEKAVALVYRPLALTVAELTRSAHEEVNNARTCAGRADGRCRGGMPPGLSKAWLDKAESKHVSRRLSMLQNTDARRQAFTSQSDNGEANNNIASRAYQYDSLPIQIGISSASTHRRVTQCISGQHGIRCTMFKRKVSKATMSECVT